MQDTTPVLHHRQEFEALLQDYQISDDAKAMLARIPLVVLSGVAGGGRNTTISYLVEHYNYEFVISDTTRPPKFRDGKMEQDGINYYFRREDDVLAEIQNGQFVEAELIHNQQVSGTSMRELARIAESGKTPIHEVEFGGANAIAKAKPDATIIGLLPPSYEEWMRRLNARETMAPEELQNRLVTAEKVLENMLAKPYFTYILNDNVEQGAEMINTAVYRPDQLQGTDEARQVAIDILARVKEILAQ